MRNLWWVWIKCVEFDCNETRIKSVHEREKKKKHTATNSLTSECNPYTLFFSTKCLYDSFERMKNSLNLVWIEQFNNHITINRKWRQLFRYKKNKHSTLMETMNVPLKKRHNYGKLNGSVSSLNEPSAKRLHSCKFRIVATFFRLFSAYEMKNVKKLIKLPFY